MIDYDKTMQQKHFGGMEPSRWLQRQQMAQQ